MPCYQLVLFARPDITPERLAHLFRSVARVVYREHGQFRTIQNYGVRPLAFPIRQDGQKFEEVRWVHASFDVAPPSLAAIGAAATSDKGVLQYKMIKRTDYLAEFKPHARVKLKPFSAAMRYNKAIFDPESLVTRPPGSEGAIGVASTAAETARAATLGKATSQLR